MTSRGKNQTAYADCFSGVSGDMFLGALIDAGLDPEYLQTRLAGLELGEFALRHAKQQDQNLSSTRLVIEVKKPAASRSWKNIRSIIEESDLKNSVKEKSLRVFGCLAEAEAKIHNCPVDEVHFHEVGSLDSIIDIVGAAIGLDFFKIDRLVTSPLPMPRGWVKCAHGMLPLPAPAVCEILQDVPVYGVDFEQELVTPTGAALVKTLSSGFGNFPPMKISRTGYGAGSRKLPGGFPNLFRLVIGPEQRVEELQEVEIIETSIDDLSPEIFPHLSELLFSAGALDVMLVQMHMKKGRPGFLLSVVANPANSLEIKNCIFRETTSIGLRFRREKRMTLPRRTGTVQTPWGQVQVKLVETPSGYRLYPEYEDCRRMALENNVPLKDVYAAVNRCAPDDFEKE